MLSGFTQQLGGLIGRKNQDDNTENPPSEPTNDPSTPTNDNSATNKSRSGSTANVESGSVLQNVRSQLPSWLGGGGKGGEESPPQLVAPPSTSLEGQTVSQVEGEGAEGTPQPGAGLEKVKTLGNFLFTTIKGAGQKIKDTNMVLEFEKEHELFVKARGGGGQVVAPWVGHSKEEALKEEILSLSTDRRNFVRSPPTGVSFAWDFEEMLPVAKAILKEDPNLEKMRYELVPKVISEENFWRNYFYRVTLLKESLSDDSPSGTKKQDSIETDEEDAELEKELNDELKSFEVVEGGKVDEKEIDSMLDLK